MQPRSPRIHPPGRYLEQRREELDAWAERESENARARLEDDREWVRQNATCPVCGADLGEPCRTKPNRRTGATKPRVGNHKPRINLALGWGWHG